MEKQQFADVFSYENRIFQVSIAILVPEINTWPFKIGQAPKGKPFFSGDNGGTTTKVCPFKPTT